MGACRARGITALSAPSYGSYDSGSSWPPAGVLAAAATVPYQDGWNSGHLCTTAGQRECLKCKAVVSEAVGVLCRDHFSVQTTFPPP